MKKIEFEYDLIKHEQFFYAHLSEVAQRQYAGLESMRSDYNGVAVVSERLGIHKHTVRKGKKELENEIIPREGFIRCKGGGRKKTVVVNEPINTIKT
ncbi:hypothetical protein EZS27_022047 [termite gut metagenome]|uniref:Uncharacterized protein n=1 Tax=termite gut metagenome TaxID=433724 RepID=A0A5J4R7N9_9ZZZZ